MPREGRRASEASPHRRRFRRRRRHRRCGPADGGVRRGAAAGASEAFHSGKGDVDHGAAEPEGEMGSRELSKARGARREI